MQWLKRAENKNLKITHVGALDGDSFGITLESGHTILLELGNRIRFCFLIKSKSKYGKCLTPGRIDKKYPRVDDFHQALGF